MAWYRAGTIAIANGSTAVVGTGTTFDDTAAGVNAGDALIVGTGTSLRMYEIASVNNATSLTLATPATIAAAAGSAYQIQTSVALTNQSLGKKVAAAMDRILSGISNWMLIFKGSGDITITNYDGSTATGKAWPTLSSLASNSIQRDGSVAMATSLQVPSLEMSADLPYIDMKYNKSTADFNVRIANSGDGILSIADANGYGRLDLRDIRLIGGTNTLRWFNADQSKQFNIQMDPNNNQMICNYSAGMTRFNFSGQWVTGNSLSALGNVANMGQQGIHMVWNETGDGMASLVNNKGAGIGGIKFRMVNAANNVQDALFTMGANGVFAAPNGSTSASGRVRAFTAVGSGYLEVYIDGSAYAVNFTASDATLKENVGNADEDLARQVIAALRPVSYKFKDIAYTYQEAQSDGSYIEREGVREGAVHKFGVIAQELEKLLPTAIITASDGKKSLDTLECLGLLLTLAHSQQREISEQAERLSALESAAQTSNGA